MKKEVLENLNNINESEKKELIKLLEDNTSISEYLKFGYEEIMNRWKSEYPMFDIPTSFVSISINGVTKYYNLGNNHYDENTIFDIASMTKLYTEFILFDVIDEYGLSLDTKIRDIVSFYESIGDLTLMDLISFNNTYKTKIDIRECKNKKEAIEALRTIYIDEEKIGYYLYTDLPIMVLTDIMEEYTSLSYKELFDKYIISKYNLNDTYLDINMGERYITVNKNLVNDPKANIMGGYYGHGGVKASSKDFIKFLNSVFESKYRDLFTTVSKTLNSDGSACVKKALIGNLNLSVSNDDSLASKYLPKEGFAIQGSVRCHGETAIFKVDHKEYEVSISIFMDLYTQVDNILEYEKVSGNVITKEYSLNGYDNLIMCDVRSLLSYKKHYKELTNLVGKAGVIELYNHIKEVIRSNYSE